ncbi:myrosinase 1-like [Colias croceus]|uniref:myrosinase 1-like n=1 Tax=Colias crocea TaxID=72248 RepID=UPI001E27AF68|nr:myrosinase 1-like [Colias croceus]
MVGCSCQKLPQNFKFGAATAAYQIEGGWKADGKGKSVWDEFVHTHKDAIEDRTNGDVAADSYHLWREDVRIASQLGLDHYRFSISWSRILPSGLPNNVNKAGVKYYSDLIDELLRQGIEPVVTMYHFDLPLTLQSLGGWTNPLIVDWFSDYAKVLYSLFADRVKTWITMNEAVVLCDMIFNTGSLAPGIKEEELAPFLCNKYLLLAHAKAYRIYEREYKNKYHGRISLANNIIWIEPYKHPRDKELAKLGLDFMIGRYSHPIYSKEGGWPPTVEKILLEYSLKQGYNYSRLPSFTEEEKKLLKGSADFYAVNYYTTYVIRPAKKGERGFWFLTGSPELDAMMEKPAYAEPSAGVIMPVYPKGLRQTLSYLKKNYGDIDIMITENGYAGKHQMYDHVRLKFIKDHLTEVYLAINEDKVNVIGYTYWALMDNFEWNSGYSVAFGLYAINHDDPKKIRSPRLSSQYYACVIKTHEINVSDQCINENIDKLHLPHYHSFTNRISASKTVIVVLFLGFMYIYYYR